MKEFIVNVQKSVASGLLIAIGGTVYLSCRTINCGSMNLTWLGAFLFASGLLTICIYGFNLYTGKVGYIAYNFKDFKYIGLVVQICIVNLLTTFLLGIVVAYVYPKVGIEAFNIYTPKLEMPLLKVFISATFCGLLMFLAVDTWSKGKIIGCIYFIPTFIFSGFDHSIANNFYNGAALGHQLFADELLVNDGIIASRFNAFSITNIILIIITVLGNAFGGMLIPLLTKSGKK